MKGLRANKTFKEIKFEVVWSNLEAKNVSKINLPKISETNYSFHVN